MPFLPRRRGQSFGGFGRMPMRRPSFRGAWRPVKKPITVSYIDVSTAVSLAATVDANYSLLIASDSPNKSLVTDLASVAAQCENNTRIVKKGSFLTLNFFCDSPGVVNAWVYMNTKGNIVAPVDSDDFNQGPLLQPNADLRRVTIFYRTIPLSSTQATQVRIPLGSKRNNFMTDGSILVLALDNQTAAASISFNGYGRIRTIEG